MRRFILAVAIASFTCSVSAPCMAQTQYHWTFDEPFVTLPNSGHYLATATVYNTGTTTLVLRTGVTFALSLTPEFLAVTSNHVVGATSDSGDFVRQFFDSSSYPIAPGGSFQFAAFNFDYNAPDGVYGDVVTDGYLRLSPDPVGPSNSITFSFKSGVPEPATWALMILGFGLIGAAMRRPSGHRARVSYS